MSLSGTAGSVIELPLRSAIGMFTLPHVRFGSKADICSAKRHVRYGPTVFGWPFIAAAQEILFSEAAIRCLEE